MKPYIWYDYPYDGDFSQLGPRKRKMAEAARRHIIESAEAGLMDTARLRDLFSSIPFLSDAALARIGNARGISVDELREFYNHIISIPATIIQSLKRDILMIAYEKASRSKWRRLLREYSIEKLREEEAIRKWKAS